MTINKHPHISALHMVRRRDKDTGKQEKILVLETDVNIPKPGQECEDVNLYMVLRQLEGLRHEVEDTYGEFDLVEIRNMNDNRMPQVQNYLQQH